MHLATSADYYFGADSIALRATFRFGAKIARQVRAKGNTKVGRRDTRQLMNSAPGSLSF